ncbi:MAG: SDR family oxidoreductase [Arenimonas sp.]|nr:SDR family oxidoreductase [Arenimonas sp.]MBP6309083.1 SDR family oxidoreductase [Arenimonas sp.]
MSSNLIGKKALVCGSSEGIGLACAQALAAQGASVTLLARRETALQSALNTLHCTESQSHAYIQADVLHLDDVLDQIQKTGFDILINNSAGPAGGALQNATDQQLMLVFQQHVLSAQRLLKAVLPHMQKQQWGRIVNIISTSVKEPIAMLGVSNTIRGAMASWSKTLATELGGDGITCNNVLPGYTKTQRLEQILLERSNNTGKSIEHVSQGMLATVPAARFAEPLEIAHAVAFLCHINSGYINGINLPVDGGRTKSL